MPAKTKDRSASKQRPKCQCQEQIKDILTRLEVLEANATKITAVIKPVNGEDLLDERFADLKVVVLPPRPEFERFIKKVPIQLIANESARQLPRKRRKR